MARTRMQNAEGNGTQNRRPPCPARDQKHADQQTGHRHIYMTRLVPNAGGRALVRSATSPDCLRVWASHDHEPFKAAVLACLFNGGGALIESVSRRSNLQEYLHPPYRNQILDSIDNEIKASLESSDGTSLSAAALLQLMGKVERMGERPPASSLARSPERTRTWNSITRLHGNAGLQLHRTRTRHRRHVAW